MFTQFSEKFDARFVLSRAGVLNCGGRSATCYVNLKRNGRVAAFNEAIYINFAPQPT